MSTSFVGRVMCCLLTSSEIGHRERIHIADDLPMRKMKARLTLTNEGSIRDHRKGGCGSRRELDIDHLRPRIKAPGNHEGTLGHIPDDHKRHCHFRRRIYHRDRFVMPLLCSQCRGCHPQGYLRANRYFLGTRDLGILWDRLRDKVPVCEGYHTFLCAVWTLIFDGTFEAPQCIPSGYRFPVFLEMMQRSERRNSGRSSW